MKSMRRDPYQKAAAPSPVFIDRSDAGVHLASALTRYVDPQTIIYALANGGAVVGYEVAQALHMPMELILSGSIMHPLSPSFAVCAITEYGERVCDEVGICALDETWVEHETEYQIRETGRRRRLLGTDEMEDLTHKTVILIDDGMVTGLPMKAAILTIKRRHPARIIIAVPSAPFEVAERIKPLVDEVIVLAPDKQYRGVTKAYYKHFPPVSDAEVQELRIRLKAQRTHL